MADRPTTGGSLGSGLGARQIVVGARGIESVESKQSEVADVASGQHRDVASGF